MGSTPAEARLLPLLLQQGEEHAVMLIDMDGVIRDWLMGSRRIFGYTAEQIVGSTTDPLFPPEARERGVPAEELRTAAIQGKAEDDRWMLRADGVRFWATGLVYALRGPDGELVGYAKVLRDRTDQRGQIESLRNRAEALAAAERRKTVALATLAHELRSPLEALANGAHVIGTTRSSDPRLANAAQLIGRQIKYMSKLIEDLIEIVRVQSGKAVLQLERVQLAALIDAAVETAGAALAAKGQRVEMLVDRHPIHLEADAARLQQVIVNLIANASRFSAAGSTIWLKGTVEADEVVVRVEDQGAGIPPDVLPHIFELFSQAEPVAGERAKGLGLGLSIVKEYVELHGGTVQVRSEGPGRGAEFTIRVPQHRAV
jgi:PAS domain S-box-containing protein